MNEAAPGKAKLLAYMLVDCYGLKGGFQQLRTVSALARKTIVEVICAQITHGLAVPYSKQGLLLQVSHDKGAVIVPAAGRDLSVPKNRR